MNNFYQSLLNQRDPQAEEMQKQLMQQYNDSLAQRQQSIQEAKQRAMELEGSPRGFDELNLKPLASAVDAWTGSNMANAYQAPPAAQNRELMLEKLRQAVGNQEAGLIDDRLNVTRLMMEDNRSKENNAFKANQAELDAGLKYELLRRKNEAQGELAATKANSKIAGGIQKDEQNILKTKESQNIQNQIKFVGALDAYERAIDKYGIQLTGAGKDELESLYNKLTTKHKEGENLGALTGPDMGIMVKSIAPATGFSGAARLAGAKMGFGGGVEGIKKGIASVRAQAEKDFKTSYSPLESAYGLNSSVLENYRKTFYGRGAGDNSPPSGAAVGPEVKVRIDGQIMSIPREDLESALRDGAEVVK